MRSLTDRTNMINHTQENNFVLAEPENYKGIVYIRLSALPDEQRSKIRESYAGHYIFKILKDHSLMNDCMIYTDYVAWHKQHNSSVTICAGHETAIHPEFS